MPFTAAKARVQCLTVVGRWQAGTAGEMATRKNEHKGGSATVAATASRGTSCDGTADETIHAFDYRLRLSEPRDSVRTALARATLLLLLLLERSRDM